MGLREFWLNNKVLIVMGTSLGLIHWGWYNLKSSSLLRRTKEEEYIPEPAIVAYVSARAPAPAAPPPAAPPAATKNQ